jgi:uncharacterized repeat protein (TIGR03803 family)
MRTLSPARTVGIVFAFCTASAIFSPAQTFTSLASFNSTGGYDPNPGVVQGFDGNFYGTTYNSDSGNGSGTVFEITPSGTLTTLGSFNYSDGANPTAGLTLATTGNFYGTTSTGGANAAGVIFDITPAGTLSAIYSLCSVISGRGLCADGFGSNAAPVQAPNGHFYGTTATGGDGAGVSGTVFKITPGGKLTTLYSFCPQYPSCGTDGRSPQGLVQATNGNFYGTTNGGGANSFGTVFKITPAGVLTTLYSFCSLTNCADGTTPLTLVQATDGNFYGTAWGGGFYNNTECSVYGCGTIFKITPGGILTTLYTFQGTDGTSPDALVQATDGNFYGTSGIAGSNNFGTIFEITAAGKLTFLHTFTFSDGAGPYGLVQATNGSFYGTAAGGGANGVGTVFSLSVGLGPFVETLPSAAKVGAKVVILGNNLTGTTNVSFNGTAAKFTVISNTAIRTTVPTGATSGVVEVATPSGTLKSNVRFRVVP